MPDPSWAPLVEKLVSYRRAAGLTQKDVAERMNMSQATVSDFERIKGADGPRVVMVQRYARAIGVRVTWRFSAREEG